MFTGRNIVAQIALVLAALGNGIPAIAADCSDSFESGLIALDVEEYTVLAYVPQSAVAKRAPLVINLHPTGGKGLRTLNESKHVADENGFVMALADGRSGASVHRLGVECSWRTDVRRR